MTHGSTIKEHKHDHVPIRKGGFPYHSISTSTSNNQRVAYHMSHLNANYSKCHERPTNYWWLNYQRVYGGFLSHGDAFANWRAFEIINLGLMLTLAVASSVMTPSGRRVSITSTFLRLWWRHWVHLNAQVEGAWPNCANWTWLETRTESAVTEAEQVFLYVALTRLFRPVVTFVVTLMAISSMSTGRKRAKDKSYT